MTPALNAILFGGGPNPTLSANFAGSAYRMGTARYSSPSDLPGWSFTRASVGWAKDSLGNDVQFLSGVPRITELGLLVEESRTNFLLNSTAPVTQTTGSLGTGTYTVWVVGSGSAAVTAGSGTATGLGTATAASPVTFTVTVAGTFTVTKTGTLTFFQLENGAFATSRIVTTGATATRAPDAVIITLTVPTDFTIIAKVGAIGAASFPAVFALNDGTANNEMQVFVAGGGPTATVKEVAGGVTQFNAGFAAAIVGAANYGVTKNGTAVRATTNGGSVTAAGTWGAITPTRFELGSQGNGGNHMSAYLKSVVMYSAGMTDGQLQAGTAQ
jgi:hypothetical protein